MVGGQLLDACDQGSGSLLHHAMHPVRRINSRDTTIAFEKIVHGLTECGMISTESSRILNWG